MIQWFLRDDVTFEELKKHISRVLVGLDGVEYTDMSITEARLVGNSDVIETYYSSDDPRCGVKNGSR